MTSYSRSIVTMALSRVVSEIAYSMSKNVVTLKYGYGSKVIQCH